MSSQKGNVTRSRPQRHQNTFSFKNDKFDKSVQTKKINAKLHDGVCQRCKEVLEWRVKYSKYKPLSKPKKCFMHILMLPPHILQLSWLGKLMVMLLELVVCDSEALETRAKEELLFCITLRQLKSATEELTV
ncbi:hypothetical protein Celaphus_00018369 [Cervus elaphus hippelaphus]|uniref:Uncharacterized protein n=1 Tax=Cervus elaphus hippelaphus TaxID=46360 RepID=A0A212C549_CEREH|nr:hypothetical protein Celaphus_00018369 [Cervus elaphus hippelaphus]